MFKRIILALMSVAFLPSANADSISKPPTNIPISFQNVGQIYSFDVDVIEQSNYSVKIKFYLTLPNKWSHSFDKESPEQSGRLYSVRVHYLQGSPELAQLHAKVSLAKAHHGK